jgi:hypothetical protein
MSNTITAHISEEAQEALEFLEKKNIDVNSTINRIIMRAAQEEGWQISLMPGREPAQGKTDIKESKGEGKGEAEGEAEPTSPESRSRDENTNLVVPAAPAQQAPPEAAGKPADPTPVPVEKPFEPGVVLAATKEYEDDLPHSSPVVKKAVVEPVAGVSAQPAVQ